MLKETFSLYHGFYSYFQSDFFKEGYLNLNQQKRLLFLIVLIDLLKNIDMLIFK